MFDIAGIWIEQAMAQRVDELCRRQSLSIEALVERSGLDANRVLAIVEGRWTPSPVERQKIAAVLGVEAGEIAWGHVTPIQHLYGNGPG